MPEPAWRAGLADVASRCGVEPAAVLSTSCHRYEVVAVRRGLIRALEASGLGVNEIARVLGLHHTTVSYHTLHRRSGSGWSAWWPAWRDEEAEFAEAEFAALLGREGA